MRVPAMQTACTLPCKGWPSAGVDLCVLEPGLQFACTASELFVVSPGQPYRYTFHQSQAVKHANLHLRKTSSDMNGEHGLHICEYVMTGLWMEADRGSPEHASTSLHSPRQKGANSTFHTLVTVPTLNARSKHRFGNYGERSSFWYMSRPVWLRSWSVRLRCNGTMPSRAPEVPPSRTGLKAWQRVAYIIDACLQTLSAHSFKSPESCNTGATHVVLQLVAGQCACRAGMPLTTPGMGDHRVIHTVNTCMKTKNSLAAQTESLECDDCTEHAHDHDYAIMVAFASPRVADPCRPLYAIHTSNQTFAESGFAL